MTFAPLHYRKLRIAEHGAFALLPFYVRCFGEGLKKICDDRGRIALDGRAPADVIARRGGAETNERRRMTADILELLRVGWLREEDDALVVVEQEQDWEQLDSSRALNMRPSSSRRTSERRPTSSQLAPDLRRDFRRSDSSTRNDSADHVASDQIYKNKQKEREEEKEKRGECEGGQAPRTDPTPTLRKQKLDEALGKGPASWGLDGSGPDLDSRNPITEGPEAQNHPTHLTARPSPPAPRQEPFVAVVEPKPVPTSSTRPSANVAPTVARPPTKAKGGKRASAGGECCIPEDWSVSEVNYEHGAKFYGHTRSHVDVEAQAFRDQYAASPKMYADWDAHFRTWMRWGHERRNGKPPILPVQTEPKRKVPLAPLPSKETLEGAERSRQRMLRGEDWKPDFSKVGWKLPPLPPDPPELEIWRKEDEAAAVDL